MSYVQKILLPKERLIYLGRLHWVVFLPGLAFVVVSSIMTQALPLIIKTLLGPEILSMIALVVPVLSALVFVVGVFLLAYATVRQSTTELAITDRRIIAKYGFISRSTYEIMNNRITGANFDQSIAGRLLGYGTVVVHGAGGDISPFDVIADPQSFNRALVHMMSLREDTTQSVMDKKGL